MKHWKISSKNLTRGSLGLLVVALILFLRNCWRLQRLAHSGDGLSKSFIPSRRDTGGRRIDYVQDNLCSGCRLAIIKDERDGVPVTRCGTLIQEHVASSRMSTERAARLVAQLHPEECARCAASCDAHERRYWRYDRILMNKDYGAKSAWTMLLPSIPERNRLPASAFYNVTTYFIKDENAYPNKEYFFDYNPSIVALPEAQRLPELPKAVYLASFRVSNRHYCLHPEDRRLMMRGHTTPPRDGLGLALLDAGMNILRDTVLDLGRPPSGFAQGGVEDFRLFVLGNQLYVASNDMIAPLWLRNSPDQSLLVPPFFPNTDHLEESTGIAVYVRPFASCAPCGKPRGLCGKNLNYFANASGAILAELWPSPPHTVRALHMDRPCERQQEMVQHIVDTHVLESGQTSSFATLEELQFGDRLGAREALLTRGRGGACCVPVVHPATQQPLWMGIMHSKTPSQRRTRLGNLTDNHYLSRLYAFERSEPYRIVAMSGLFCLGFPTEREQRQVPLVRLTTWRTLQIGQEYDCPRIHFVSGMTVAVDDPTTAIIAYGINDCVSRMIRVPIKDIEQLLFVGK